MPRHTRMPPEAGAERDRLLDELTHELREPKGFGQPIILEDATPETNSLRVHVVWDEWETCPRQARSEIILQAYGAAWHSQEAVDKISLALGLTVPEAAAIGLLPFRIVPAANGRHGGPSEEACRDAMVSAGASVLLSKQAPILRCATLEDAEKTLEYLEQTLPDSKWRIIEELVPSEERLSFQ